MERHRSEEAGWVLTAIGGTKPDDGERSSLANVLGSADYFNRAAISKDELEHGVRDLVTAGLISVEGNTFALTDRGREMWDGVCRAYQARPRGDYVVRIAEQRLKSIRCSGQLAGWSLTPQEFDTAFDLYRRTLIDDLRRTEPKVADLMEQDEQLRRRKSLGTP
jgi:hypothetical protein